MPVLPPRDRRILVVEDAYSIAMALKHDLAAAGAEVLGPVPSVTTALALIAAESEIGAAVVDLNLGGGLSFSVAEALSARGIPFVFATGYADGGFEARDSRVPRCDKPLDFPVLERMLASIL